MRQKSIPKYRRVSEALLAYFVEHSYRYGEKLPTEYELIEEFKVSRTTIRQALSLLQDSGIVETKQGSGTYYCSSKTISNGSADGNKLIGLVNFFSMEYIYAEIVRGLRDTIEHAGYHLVLSHCDTDSTKEVTYIERLISQQVKGLVIEPSQHINYEEDSPLLKFIRNSPVPVVATHWDAFFTGCSVVAINDEYVGYRATRYLLEKGHTNIAIVYTRSVRAGIDRFNGYMKALGEYGIGIDPTYVKSYTNEEEFSDTGLGMQLTYELCVETKKRPTAIFYFNDLMAQQGYRALHDLGLSIPSDISVIGFDNYRSSALLRPGLTTFEHPKYQLGMWTGRILLDRIENRQSMPVRMIFEPPCVERDSVQILHVNKKEMN